VVKVIKRVFHPKLKAQTFKDKRTKRERTRSAKLNKVLKEYK